MISQAAGKDCSANQANFARLFCDSARHQVHFLAGELHCTSKGEPDMCVCQLSEHKARKVVVCLMKDVCQKPAWLRQGDLHCVRDAVIRGPWIGPLRNVNLSSQLRQESTRCPILGTPEKSFRRDPDAPPMHGNHSRRRFPALWKVIGPSCGI